MRRLLTSLAIGWVIFALVLLLAGMLAPFLGRGPVFHAALATTCLLALGAGALVAAGGAPGAWERFGMIAAGLWALPAPFVHDRILGALDRLGLEAALVSAMILLAGPPLFLLGGVLVRQGGTAPASPTSPHLGQHLGAGLVGAALATSMVRFAMIPALGIARSWLVCVAVVLALGGVRLLAERRVKAGIGVILASVLVLATCGARLETLPPGVIAIDHGVSAEHRILERNGARYLLADGTILALTDIELGSSLHRATAALEVMPHFYGRAGRMLILGLRGGSLAQNFAARGWEVVVVEPDPASLRLATRHFALRPHQARVHVGDERSFVLRDRSLYDLAIIDHFGDDSIPAHLVTEEFFDLVHARLSPGGILAVAVETEGWEDPFLLSLAETLRSAFGHVIALPTSEPPDALGSIILLASDRDLEIPEGAVVEPGDVLADPHAHWMAIQVAHAWANRYEPASGKGVRVLRDDGSPVDPWSARIGRASRLEVHRFFGPAAYAW